MVGVRSARKTGISSGDDMGVDGCIGGSRRCDEPRGRCGTDREDCGAVDSGVPGAKVTRWRGEEPRVGAKR